MCDTITNLRSSDKKINPPQTEPEISNSFSFISGFVIGVIVTALAFLILVVIL